MLTFSHPLAELAAIKGLYEPHLFPLLYKHAGTHVIHDKSDYSDVNKYYEIINKVLDFVYHTIPILSIMKPFNPSDELTYKVVKQFFFNRNETNYSYVEPVELREKLVEFFADKKRINDAYFKAQIGSFMKQTDLKT